MRVYPVYLCFWLVLMVLAVCNGVLREGTFGKYLPELRAHQLSTLLAAGIFGLAVWLFSRRWLAGSAKEAWLIGCTWLAMTLCFEFSFGHYVAGHSWGRLLQDYDLLSGRVWVLLLAWVTALPYLVYKIRGRRAMSGLPGEPRHRDRH